MRRGKKVNRLMDFWLGIPLLNIMSTAMVAGRRRPWPERVTKIGVLCSPALGDTLLFSAALQDIRAHFSDAVQIIHFCMPQNIAAAELIPGADSRVLLNLTKIGKTIKQLRSEQLDVLLDFSSWQRLTAFYSLTAGARFTAGFRTKGQHRGRGYDLAVVHRSDQHEVCNFKALLEGVGISTQAAPCVRLPALTEEPLPNAQDIVVLHLWASGDRHWLREWPEDRWIELAARLAKPDTTFVITGSTGDQVRMQQFLLLMAKANLSAVPFVGRDGFVSLSHLLKRARMVVSVNTGVMHLAAILGTPTISINGPNRNGRWGPVGPRAIGVEAPGQGCGYLHLGFDFDGNPTDCMERTTVDMVVAAVHQLTANTEDWGSQCRECGTY
jgi:ADP-heptose:LPS heptosyltransferase